MSDTRISRDVIFMEVARIIGLRSTCTRAQVGAIIVVDNRIVSSGYVGSPPGLPHCQESGCEIDANGGCIRTLHAESNAIAWAARTGTSINGGSLYCDYSPCLACAKLMVQAGISNLYYAKQYRITDGIDYLRRCGVAIIYIPRNMMTYLLMDSSR